MLLCSISCVSTGAVGTTKGVFTVCVFVMAYSMMAGIIEILYMVILQVGAKEERNGFRKTRITQHVWADY